MQNLGKLLEKHAEVTASGFEKTIKGAVITPTEEL